MGDYPSITVDPRELHRLRQANQSFQEQLDTIHAQLDAWDVERDDAAPYPLLAVARMRRLVESLTEQLGEAEERAGYAEEAANVLQAHAETAEHRLEQLREAATIAQSELDELSSGYQVLRAALAELEKGEAS